MLLPLRAKLAQQHVQVVTLKMCVQNVQMDTLQWSAFPQVLGILACPVLGNASHVVKTQHNVKHALENTNLKGGNVSRNSDLCSLLYSTYKENPSSNSSLSS